MLKHAKGNLIDMAEQGLLSWISQYTSYFSVG